MNSPKPETFIAQTCAALRVAIAEFEAAEKANKDGILIAKLGKKVILITNVLEDVDAPERRTA